MATLTTTTEDRPSRRTQAVAIAHGQAVQQQTSRMHAMILLAIVMFGSALARRDGRWWCWPWARRWRPHGRISRSDDRSGSLNAGAHLQPIGTVLPSAVARKFGFAGKPRIDIRERLMHGAPCRPVRQRRGSLINRVDCEKGKLHVCHR